MESIILFTLLCLSTSQVNGQDEHCGGGDETKCNKIQSVIELVEDTSCHGGDPSVNKEGSYMADGPLLNKLGEIVRLTRSVVTGLKFIEFEECLPDAYKTPYLCYPPPLTCANNPDSYASYDGTCNNLNNPRWGSIGEAQRRLKDPVYNGNYYKARLIGKDGLPLPSPRHISNIVFNQLKDESKDAHKELTMWVWAFAQLIDHDLTFTPVIKDNNGKGIDCCGKQMGECPIACMPISVAKDDPHFRHTGQTCINFVRSVSTPCCSENCDRTPINMISAYFDANPTYGNSAEQAKAFRTNDGAGAKLKVSQYENEGTYLPRNNDQANACVDSGKLDEAHGIPHCMTSGDPRMHVVPSLTALITLFNREHNRIVEKLAALNNPYWDEEKLYQEARKIVIAEYQMFGLRDLMAKTVLGKDLANEYNLNEEEGYRDIYDPNINAQMSAAFPTAAFRFGHGLINTLHGQYDKANKIPILKAPIHDQFDCASMVFEKDGPSGILRFLTQEKMGKADSHISKSMRDLLFLNKTTHKSLDLGALNIQRGRDHGLPTYNEWRTHYGLPTFPHGHSGPIIDEIRKAYNDREDEIDMFVGALTEDHVEGAIVGPLFGKLLGEQFRRLKFGDRFYYQNSPESGPNAQTIAGRFKSSAQVKSLQRLTLARVLCENSETVKVQKDLFREESTKNPMVNCNDYAQMPDIDFSLWDENWSPGL